ncbi:uncharacterized protein FIBRA_04165 [Fibroporia radiculosa]|uniref:Uncharacterized protein n=1 Tax=Fibroporia radiculosa TaxID=599839 RepID=J4G6Y0_9APHY|nr:uncharacterized protein FIBRA_04165 [Fibroporia radiculosa]CCM02088.1 predicted protein [Fibroporia radiculosa]
MASPQDVLPPPPAAVDSQHFQHFPTSEGLPTFSPLVPSSHSVDPSLPPSSAPHVRSLIPSLFQSEVDHAHAVPVAMQLSLTSLPTSGADMAAMDVVSAVTVDSATTQGLVPSYTQQSNSFSMDYRVNGLEGLDTHHQIASSPSANTVSSNPSHASSPAANGVTSSYSVTSSLASALDCNVSRSRSGSSASPPHLLSSASDLTFSSGSSVPPTSIHDAGFQYPLTVDNAQSVKENSPEQPGSAHLMVLGDMLKNIARQANSGSQACDMGSTTHAQQIVDVLKKNVLLVADLVAALQLADGPTSSSHSSPHSNASAPGGNGVLPAPPPAGQQNHINGLASYASSANPLDPSGMADASDSSRKRCASAIDGDRALKSMKLEPQDDTPPLQMPPASAIPLSGSLLSQSGFSFASPMSSIPGALSSMNDIAPIPSSLPLASSSSRPQSSAGLTHHPLGIMSEAHQSTHSLQSALHYSVLDHAHPPSDFTSPPASSGGLATTLPSVGFNPSLPSNMWAEGPAPVVRHHQHSLSAGSVLPGIPESISGPSSLQYPPSIFNAPSMVAHLQQSSTPIAGSSPANVPPLPAVRSSRSSSFALGQGEIHPLVNSYDMILSRTSGMPSRPSSPEFEDEMDMGHDSDEYDSGPSPAMHQSSPGADTMECRTDGEAGSAAMSPSGQRRLSRGSPSADGGSTSSGHGNEVPQEYRAEVERIFFEFLNSICSNLDAKDAKGEPIHQTLMAKKMQRLDESPDFRPFKFRIQAFTNAFLEELARQGYPEEKIPMKKASVAPLGRIRNFLWNQPYISRFNEDGKKSKSKGNHIWHVDAKKSDGGWMFRPFRRKLAGTPPGVAYVGLRWSWTPRIWDPQASRSNMPVQYSSPSLPLWLSWKDDIISGIPTPDAQSCDVTVEARFIQDGKEELLSHTVHITIAPMASVDSTFTPSRRPSLVGDIHNPRRVLSDPMVTQAPPPRLLRTQSALAPTAPVAAPDSQVVQVLTTAAQRVAQEAQSQVVASPNDAGPGLQALAKQQHVLTVTAQAFNSKMSREHPDGSDTQSNALTAAAQQVVLQAARQVAADRTVVASSGISTVSSVPTPVTVKDVSVATQSAVAQAVDMVGPLSSEVDVLMTASSLLQQQTRTPLPPSSVMDSALAAAEPVRQIAGTPPTQYVTPSIISTVPIFYTSS